MRVFLDNKGVSTLWSQFKAKLAVHANNSDIHVTAEEKAAWDGKAELSDIPTTLPANGGNADSLNGFTVPNSGLDLLGNPTASGGRPVLGAFDDSNGATAFYDIRESNGDIARLQINPYQDPVFKVYKYVASTDTWSLKTVGNADTLDGKHASEFVPYHRYAPIYTGDILDIPEMGTYSCAVDGCTNLPSEIASWCYVTAFDFRDAGYKRFICVALNDVAVYPNVIWLASESNKTSDGKLIWSKANDGGNAATLDGKHASDFSQIINLENTSTDTKTAVGILGQTTTYWCSNWTDYPAEAADGQGMIIAAHYNGAGTAVGVDSMWVRQLYITPHYNQKIWQRLIVGTTVGEWTNIADGGNAATVNGYTVNANVPAGFSSIGQNTENKTYTYRGATYTGSNTSEVFNNYTNMAANEYSHAEGSGTKALGDQSHAEGSGTKALGFHSHAECSSTEASGDGSHAEGMNTTASGEGSHAEGSMTSASSSASHAEGYGTTASSFASHAGGKYNKAMTNSTGETDNTGDAFVIGNGTETSALSNAFRVTYGGAVYGLSAFNSSGADYAEFIKPWYDGNTEEEDRVGYFVTIKNGLLYKANEGDYIVGITSGNPSVVGNADEDYYWRYERDEFNRFVYEDAEEEVEQLDDNGTPMLDENGMPVMVKTGNIIKNAHYKLAADYNPTKQNDYIERKNRPEWSYVGMVGVIPVRDDGTCEAGCFCKCGQNGIATRAESRGFDTFFVIERISDNVVSVEIR